MSKRGESECFKNPTTFHCHLSYSVFEFQEEVILPLRSVVGLDFVKQCSVVLLEGTGLRIRMLSSQAEVGSHGWEPSVSHFTSMSFSVLVQNGISVGPDNLPCSCKNWCNSRKKKKRISEEGRSEREKKEYEGSKELFWDYLCLSVVVSSVVLRSMSLFSCCLQSSLLAAYCFANCWPC